MVPAAPGCPPQKRCDAPNRNGAAVAVMVRTPLLDDGARLLGVGRPAPALSPGPPPGRATRPAGFTAATALPRCRADDDRTIASAEGGH